MEQVLTMTLGSTNAETKKMINALADVIRPEVVVLEAVCPETAVRAQTYKDILERYAKESLGLARIVAMALCEAGADESLVTLAMLYFELGDLYKVN